MVIKALTGIIPSLLIRDEGAYFLYSQGGAMGAVLAVVSFLVLALAAFVLVLWTIMPFSVFGLKRLLRQCINEQKKTNTLLQEMMERGEADTGPSRKAPSGEEALHEILPLDDEPRDF